jgi:hypothetical protein
MPDKEPPEAERNPDFELHLEPIRGQDTADTVSKSLHRYLINLISGSIVSLSIITRGQGPRKTTEQLSELGKFLLFSRLSYSDYIWLFYHQRI